MSPGPVTSHALLLANMQALQARLKSEVGAVPHPHAAIFAVHSIPFAPGQTVYDTVTAQNGVIRGAGQILTERQNSGS